MSSSVDALLNKTIEGKPRMPSGSQRCYPNGILESKTRMMAKQCYSMDIL